MSNSALLPQRLEVGPRLERLGDLPAGDIVNLRLLIDFESDDELHGVDFAGPQPCWTGRGKGGQQAIGPPGLVHPQIPALMLAVGTNMIPHRGPTAHGQDFMDLDGASFPVPGQSAIKASRTLTVVESTM
jgi:hypothetical protein